MNQLLSETESERPWQLEYADDSTEAIDEQLPQADSMAEVLLADLGDLRREIAQERRRAAAAERERDELRDYTRVILQFVADSLADVAGPGAPDRRQWRVWLSWARIPLNAIGQFVADSLADVAGPGASGRRQWRVWLSRARIPLNAIGQFVADSLADVAGPGVSGRRQWRVWLSWARIPLNAIGQFVADSLVDVAGPGASGRRQWRVWLSQTLIALVLGLLILGAIDFLVSGDAIPILSEPNPTATLAAHGL